MSTCNTTSQVPIIDALRQQDSIRRVIGRFELLQLDLGPNRTVDTADGAVTAALVEAA